MYCSRKYSKCEDDVAEGKQPDPNRPKCTFNMHCLVRADDLNNVRIRYSCPHSVPSLNELSKIRHVYTPIYAELIRQYNKLTSNMTAFEKYRAVIEYLTDLKIPTFYHPPINTVSNYAKFIKGNMPGTSFTKGAFENLASYAVK